MKKCCAFCGVEFVASRKSQIYCSDKCRNHARYGRTREEWEKDVAKRNSEIVGLYDSGLSSAEIAERYNVVLSVVYKAWRDAGLPKRMTPFQREVKTLRDQGLCSVEISKITGKPSTTINYTAAAIGMPFSDADKARSIALQSYRNQYTKDNEKEKKIYVESFLSEGFSYVSGYTDCDCKVVILCNTCGETFERSMTSIRQNNRVICPCCAEIKKEERKHKKEEESRQKEQQRVEERERKKREKFWRQDFKQITFKTCQLCGAQHFNKNSLFCSEECRRKYTNRRHDRRIKDIVKKDLSITLEKLYKRDDGFCYLCGEKCDFDDYRIDDCGNFIVGRSYPSIDHVYPISKGGHHTWDNIKLAHHYCNTLKNDKVVSL